MASVSTILEDIDDKFCQCCVCFEQYSNPRQLPCLHRFCSDCLHTIITRSQDLINCPLCRKDFEIPENGVEGFKKDFFMNEILEFIEVQKSLQDDQIHTCFGCSKNNKSSAYCFKCKNLICNDCHAYHMTNNTLHDHRSHILTLQDVDAKNISLEKLVSLREAPRCINHPENVSNLCCKSCFNQPICVACTYGKHMGHDIQDVVELAAVERERLKHSLDSLVKYKNRIYEINDKLQSIKDEIFTTSKQEIQMVKTKYDEEVKMFQAKRNQIIEKSSLVEKEARCEYEQSVLTRKNQMEEKLQQVREEFRILEESDKAKLISKVKRLKEIQSNEDNEVMRELNVWTKHWEDINQTLVLRTNEKLEQRKEMSQQVDNTIKMYENITETGSSILSSQDKWAVVQNTCNICSATKPLCQDMQRKFPNLDKISDFSSPDYLGKMGEAITIKSKFTIEGITAENWRIHGIACTDSGSIVITGGAGETDYHITVINSDGSIKKETMIKAGWCSFTGPACYCAPFKKFQVALAFDPDGIGLFDVRDYSFVQKKMSQVTNWPSTQSVRSVTTDNNYIFIGCGNTQNIYVFDHKLNHSCTVRAQLSLKWLNDITFHEGTLVVCDSGHPKVFQINMKGCTVSGTLKTPGGRCNIPLNVKVCKHGFIYVLWSPTPYIDKREEKILTKYSKNGRSILATVQMMDSDAITMTPTNLGKKNIIVAGFLSGDIYAYDENLKL